MSQKDVSCVVDYDPFQHVNNKNPSTFWGTTFHVIFLGAGSLIFFLPKKIVCIGYLNGFLLTLLIFLFHRHNMRSILRSAYDICKFKKIPNITYADLVYEAFNIGVINRMLCTEILHVDVSLKQVMIFLLVPTLALGSLHKLKYLEPFSVIGFVFSSITGGIILYYLFTDDLPWQWPTNKGTIDKVPILVGSILVNINIAGMIIPLRDEMKYPRKFFQPLGVMNIAFTTIACVYLFLATIFAAKYDSDIPENLIFTLPPQSTLTRMILCLYTISLLFTHTLLIHVPFDVIMNDFLRDSRKLSCNKMKEHALKCALVIGCFLLAYPNPDLSLFFTISGTVGTSIDSIIFPAIVQILVEWKIGTSRLKFTITLVKNLGILAVGVGLVVAGIQDCIYIEKPEFEG